LEAPDDRDSAAEAFDALRHEVAGLRSGLEASTRSEPTATRKSGRFAKRMATVLLLVSVPTPS
jgi:hypothetical protein